MTSLPNKPESAQGFSPYRWLIVVLGLTLLVVVLYRWIDFSPPVHSSDSLRKISVVPPFSFTERSGKIITNRDLAGKIWVADFIYTTCPGPCPLVTANMANLQAAVADDPHVQLVTFTVDPETDTPAVLAKYADQFGADPNRWWFLTGPQKPLYDLIRNGFLLGVEDNSDKPPEPGQYKVSHSTYFSLVDGDGNVRGIYNGAPVQGQPVDQAGLLRDIKALEKEMGP